MRARRKIVVAPMKDIMDLAIAAEASGAVLNASVFGGFPHADIPHLSCSAVIVGDRRSDQGRALLARLLDMAWERREAFLYRGAPLSAQIAHARTLGDGPILLVDHGDNTASGGTQDVMSVTEAAMRQGLEDVVAGPICDPASVGRILAAGTAASVTLPLGGKVDMPQIHLGGKPLTVTGKVTRITEGEFVVTGPMATGTRVRMGRTAVLDTGAMQIVIAEGRSEPFDLGVFTPHRRVVEYPALTRTIASSPQARAITARPLPASLPRPLPLAISTAIRRTERSTERRQRQAAEGAAEHEGPAASTYRAGDAIVRPAIVDFGIRRDLVDQMRPTVPTEPAISREVRVRVRERPGAPGESRRPWDRSVVELAPS